MTTNQTIDGASLRAIEWAFERLEICQDQAFQTCECEECEQCGKMPDECSGTGCAKTCQCSTCDHCSNALAMDELRALLDAPAATSDGVNWKAVANEQMGIIQALKAAQPQGEPVAWAFKEYVWVTGLGSYVWRDQLEADKPNEKEREVREVVRLYAEQPAPVAVVMPARKRVHPSSPLHAEAEQWNACLDELKRLNTARPAHATPPPGTEPCGTHIDNDGLDEWRKPTCCGSCPGGCVIK